MTSRGAGLALGDPYPPRHVATPPFSEYGSYIKRLGKYMNLGNERVWSLVGVICVALLLVSQAQAQEPAADAEYKSLPIADQYKDISEDQAAANRSTYNEKRRALMNLRREKQSSVSDLLKGKSSSSNANDMQQWFSGYIIPQMTQTDDASLRDLGKNRKAFFRYYLPKEASGQLRNQVIQQVVPAMQEIAKENYHPACRINAVVVLSQLNSREGNRGAQQLPVPYAPMLNWLSEVVAGDTYPDYLKAPALAGIERHAAVRGPFTNQALSEQEVATLGDEMVKVLKMNPETVEDVDPDLVQWMQRRAVRTLGMMGKAGENGKYAKAIRDTMTNEDVDMKTRVDAVAAYGMLDFREQKGEANLKVVVPKIGELLAQSAVNESNYIDEMINDIRVTSKFLDNKDALADDSTAEDDSQVGLGGMADGGSKRGSSSKNNIPEILPTYQRELVRRRIKHHANVTLIALNGNARPSPPMPGLKDYAEQGTDEAALIDQLITDIETLMAQANVKAPEPEEEEDDDEDEDERDRNKKDDEKEVRTESLAEELKGALARASSKLQATVDKYAPKEAAAEGPADAAAGESSAGQ